MSVLNLLFSQNLCKPNRAVIFSTCPSMYVINVGEKSRGFGNLFKIGILFLELFILTVWSLPHIGSTLNAFRYVRV